MSWRKQPAADILLSTYMTPHGGSLVGLVGPTGGPEHGVQQSWVVGDGWWMVVVVRGGVRQMCFFFPNGGSFFSL